MIWLYSGTPGSGKSYHAVADIYHRLKRKKGFNRVIANFSINTTSKNFRYVDNSELTVKYLTRYAFRYHKRGIEAQTLVVIDEAQIIFNSRNWNSAGSFRMEWITFFSQHRKLGFNFICIAQNDRMIDRQIRCLFEYEVSHMKANNYFRILPITCFLAVERWYSQKMKLSSDLIFYRRKIARLYDTMMMFNDLSDLRYKNRKIGGNRVLRGKGIKGFPPRKLRLPKHEHILQAAWSKFVLTLKKIIYKIFHF